MKKYFLLIFFFIFLTNKAWTNQNKQLSETKGCSFNINKDYAQNIDNLKIELIEVDIHDFRKWTVNGVRILTNRYRYVPEKFKRRFDSTISVTYEDGSKCLFDGRVRHSGDEKDHIGQLENSLVQSLDVHLLNGNIKGITKFKLLRPKTRGNLEDEILITELLRNLNFLAPRSIKLQARVNQVKTTMLFQEKAAKEMLEFNKRREGPILEADERFFFKAVRKIEDNNLSGWDMGVVSLLNKSSKYMLAKQVNTNILEKSEGYKKMSFNAVNNLNLIYLYFSNRFQDEINNFNYFDYDLDNNLLSTFGDSKLIKLDNYKLFMEATNSVHGLAANNRKFYWNSYENYFEPINYDSNSYINNDIPNGVVRYPISQNFYSSFNNLRNKINNLDQEIILNNLSLSGLNFSNDYLKKKINKIIRNIDQLEKNYLNNTSYKMIKHNETRLNENTMKNFHKNLKENHPQTFLIKNDLDINNFQKCEIYLEKCINLNLSPVELSSLLEGELAKDNSFFQYIGNNFDFNNSINANAYNKKNFKDTVIFYDNGVSIDFDQKNQILNLEQNSREAKAFFINGKLNNIKINFIGKQNDLNNNTNLKEFPINEKGLTGCLSFINLKIKNVSINSTNSSCEDAVNFINSSGQVDNISIVNSMSDALDIDFSNIKIKNININTAKNDCVDFSYGNYNIENLDLINCGDKALSVGEKSKLSLNSIITYQSETGIASKDSSIVKFKKGNFNSVRNCLSAYKKKQEFEGGVIIFNNMECKSRKEKIVFDKHSLINQQNKI